MRNKGGNKTKKKGKKNFRRKTFSLDDLKKIDGQEYALVEKVYGQGRYRLKCYDKISRLGIRRGKLKRFAKIAEGNLVLVSLRVYQNEKCDILHVYGEEDTNKLINANFVKKEFINSINDNEEEDNSDYDRQVNTQETLNLDTVDENEEINIDDI